jgi:hypothetical protein
VHSATQRFALLQFAREWLAPRTESPYAAQSHPAEWLASASNAAIAEAHVWLDWGIELGVFPPDPPLFAEQQAMLAEAMVLIAQEPAYRFSSPLLAELADARARAVQRSDAADDGDAATPSLQAYFQQLWQLAAAFARQRPASIMLATITLEPQKGRFSFYETPNAVAALTSDDVAAVLAWSDESAASTTAPTRRVDSGAIGVAGALQTLEHFASVRRVFDALGRSAQLASSSSDGSDAAADRRVSAADVRRFERRFAACEGWRANLLDSTVQRRFATLLDFAADLVREELIVDHGRLTRRMVDDRAAGNNVFGDSDDIEYLERFDPRAAADQWRRESDALIADWVRRLGVTQARGTPPALATAGA